MLISPKNDYFAIEHFLDRARLDFNEIADKFFKTPSAINIKLKSMFTEQINGLDEDNFQTRFQALYVEIDKQLGAEHPALLEIKHYITTMCSYRKPADPQLIAFNEFKWDSDEQRIQEWKYATKHLMNNGKLSPNGTKLRREDHPELKHSFIVAGRRILVMGPSKSSIIVGSHAYANNVKLAEDENHGTYAIKILKEKKPSLAYQRESTAALDLGMALPAFQRQNKFNFFKAYIPYVYAGISLSKYLTIPRTDEECLDIAIQMVKATLSLNSGEQSQTNKKYAHEDIHDDNITIDSKGKLHFIDFGYTVEMHKARFYDDDQRTRKVIVAIFKDNLEPHSDEPGPTDADSPLSASAPNVSREGITELKTYIGKLIADKIPLPKLLLDLKKFKEQLFSDNQITQPKLGVTLSDFVI